VGQLSGGSMQSRRGEEDVRDVLSLGFLVRVYAEPDSRERKVASNRYCLQPNCDAME
jgi:hypothetical protein